MFSSAALEAIAGVDSASGDATGEVIAMIDSILADMNLLDGIPSQLRIQLLSDMFVDSDEDTLAEAESQSGSKRSSSSYRGGTFTTKKRKKSRNEPRRTRNRQPSELKEESNWWRRYLTSERVAQIKATEKAEPIPREATLALQNFEICFEFPFWFSKSLCGSLSPSMSGMIQKQPTLLMNPARTSDS
jgi:hypothetical protein